MSTSLTDELGRKVFDVPPDVVRFVTIEHENFMRSLTIDTEDMRVVDHIQGLYAAAKSKVKIKRDVDIIVFQLLSFTHYHFLFSTACFMRCHLSEAYASLRSAIDGALVGAQIIHDRKSQIAYLKREKPFDKLIRHFRNFNDRPHKLPHKLIPYLIQMHDDCSRIASHADIEVFAHRVGLVDDAQGQESLFTIEYFQFPKETAERRLEFLSLLHVFVVILDVFSGFLVEEQSIVPSNWRDELQSLGGQIEDTRVAITAAAEAKDEKSGVSTP